MNKPPEMVKAAVNAYLLYHCFELFESSMFEVDKHWGLGYDEAYSLGIRSCPTWHENLIGCQAAAKEYGADALVHVDGFYSFNRSRTLCSCKTWRADCCCADPCWALDLDPKLAQRGILFPVRNSRGWISGIKVFRDVKDRRPFVLRVRREAA